MTKNDDKNKSSIESLFLSEYFMAALCVFIAAVGWSL